MVDSTREHLPLQRTILAEMYRNQYRRRGHDLYRPVLHNGHYMYAYEPIENFELDRMNTKDRDIYLRMIPELKTNRYVIAFQNGLFWLNAPEAIESKDGTTRIPPKRFYPFAHGVLPECMSEDSVAVSFHRMDYDFNAIQKEMHQWTQQHPDEQIIYAYRGIHMNPFNHILQCQGYNEAEMCFIFGMLGRLMFERNFRGDNFDVELCFSGGRATGKSTLMKWINYMYTCRNDVGIVSNTEKDHFALSGLMDCLVYLVYNMDSLDAKVYRNMITGGSVTLPFKHQPPREVQWSTHGVCVLDSESGDKFTSLQNHMSVVDFSQEVRDTEPDLFHQGCLRIDRFLTYIVAAYVDDLLPLSLGRGESPFHRIIPLTIQAHTMARMKKGFGTL